MIVDTDFTFNTDFLLGLPPWFLLDFRDVLANTPYPFEINITAARTMSKKGLNDASLMVGISWEEMA